MRLLQSPEMSQAAVTQEVSFKNPPEIWLERHSGLIAVIVIVIGFCWRVWLAHATFFNTDEAWHYSVANQQSLLAVYRASLSLAHPPLLIFVLYFWKHLGSSDLMLRLPGVLASTIFCWIFYKWLLRLLGKTVALVGLLFASLLPPMIALTAELRQYSFLLMFAILAASLLERALGEDSIAFMALSAGALYLAMLSHYSGFLVATTLGLYALARMLSERHSTGFIATWVFAQLAGIAAGVFLYLTQLRNLGSVYPGEPLRRFGDFYLADVYFHSGRDHLLPFLYRGTFGVFRFICGQRTAGHLATVLFIAAIILLLRKDSSPDARRRARLTAWLLAVPFLLCWIAVVAGVYPYGRSRQCIFLAIFGIAGVAFALTRIAGGKIAVALPLALGIVLIAQFFAKSYALDMRAIPEQRREHMDQAVQFLRSEVSPADVVFTDMPTNFQLQRYLCQQPPGNIDREINGFESYTCHGWRIVSTDLSTGSLTPQVFPEKLRELEHAYQVAPGTGIWVVQAAWSRGLGEALRSQSVEFRALQPQSFDYYIEIFKLPPAAPARSPQR